MKKFVHLQKDIYKLFQQLEIVGAPRLMEKFSRSISVKIKKDLEAYLKKDPASKGSLELVYNSYKSFGAVLLYRIANVILQIEDDEHNKITARKISEYAKASSGIEIHPAAQIGVPFTIDHGYGTVIGETSVIGDNCYFLNNVTLGARGIANNPNNKRHPTIGSNVQIGASASIYGPVTIGNNCFIGPYTTVTQDVPNDTRLLVKFRFQELLHCSTNAKIFGVHPKINDGRIILHGENLAIENLECFIKSGEESENQLCVLEKSKNKLVISFKRNYIMFRQILVTLKRNNRPILSLILSPNIFL